MVAAALVVMVAGGYALHGRLFGDDAAVVGDSSRTAARDRAAEDASESAGSGGSSSDGQRKAPVDAKPDEPRGQASGSDGEEMLAKPAVEKTAPEPMAEEEPMLEEEPMAEEEPEFNGITHFPGAVGGPGHRVRRC